jgi:hypothetical protein
MMGNALRAAAAIFLCGVSLQLQPRGLAVTVTNLNDSGPGSLRQAITDAPAGGTIDFAVTGTIVLTSGQLVISNDLNIIGPGATKLTLSQNSINRILLASSGAVILSGLTVANGYVDPSGGGILNLTTLTVKNCVIASNLAVLTGGGIANGGTLVVRDSLITSNTAYFYYGGGIDNSGDATIIGSTICSNRVVGQSWVAAGGVQSGRQLVVSNSTISCNQPYGIISFGGMSVVSSSTVANNQQGDLGIETSDPNSKMTIRNSIINNCAGSPITSEDYNLVQSTAFGTWFVGATNHNIYGQDPKLGPLADNGGSTPTHALRFDSPAIDAGHSVGATTDQRGLPRPVDDPNTPNADGGNGCDIGAYEADPILKVMGFEIAGAEVRVGFNSVLGRNYKLESEGNLDNSWMTLSNNIAGSGSANQTVNADLSTVPQQFYRVVLLP